MDGATKPPWTGSRRPPQPDPPRQPTGNQPLTLTLPWLAAGAGLQALPRKPPFLLRRRMHGWALPALLQSI
ncbi:hypothetical protein C1926_11990 [Stenotrophomonas sp. ZAC14A_NAIMI4_1]|nr:hypothetical protein C1926_11990 [Stenotrophomonas sp. ZAC14A_NAIMI4_1]